MITVINSGIYNMTEEDFGVNHNQASDSFTISVPTGRGTIMRFISIPLAKLDRLLKVLKDLKKTIGENNGTNT